MIERGLYSAVAENDRERPVFSSGVLKAHHDGHDCYTCKCGGGVYSVGTKISTLPSQLLTDNSINNDSINQQ